MTDGALLPWLALAPFAGAVTLLAFAGVLTTAATVFSGELDKFIERAVRQAGERPRGDHPGRHYGDDE